MSSVAHPHPHSQSAYQVRFDWGVTGAARIAVDADIVVWVDVLGEPDARATGAEAARVALAAVPVDALAASPQAEVVLAGLADAAAVARRVLDLQVELGRRAFVAVVAVGAAGAAGAAGATDASSAAVDSVRFAVEDLLAAGAVIDALAAVGLDSCSPEAAAACAAFTGLRGAVTHLVTASASARELAALGVAPADIRTAASLAPTGAVRTVRPRSA